MNDNEVKQIWDNLQYCLKDVQGIKKVAQIIVEGHKSLADLQGTGLCTPVVYQQILGAMEDCKREANEKSIAAQEDQLWAACCATKTIPSMQQYINAYPDGKYVSMAQAMIMSIQNEYNASKKVEILEKLHENINAYDIKTLTSYGITANDIRDAHVGNVPDEILNIWDQPKTNLKIGETPTSIEAGHTEVYFWGLPGSGKTCTLAAILSTAKKMGIFTPEACNGRMYMTQLSNQFFNTETTLPAPSPVEVTQGLTFDLSDERMEQHPVSLIEISGEIFKCFSNVVNGMPIPNDGHDTAYSSLHSFLQSEENPKFHFFVIDVDNKDQDASGFTQIDYLTDTATYFNEHKIFNKKTAGIYILVTKSDLLSKNPQERKVAASRELSQNYINFVNILKKIAFENQLIVQKTDPIPVIPFTLGEVFFKDKCRFDDTMSRVVIQIMQQNIAREQTKKRSWLGR